MPLERLWTAWRSAYVHSIAETRLETGPDGRTLFERILAAEGSDADKHLVRRGAHCFVLLNKFPYTSGHLLVLPNRGEPDLEGLDPAEHEELWSLVRASVVAIKSAFGCDGVNVGLNLGAAAGGSQSDHLHVHCVPRWVGDANFIGIAAETRVLPVSLDEAYERLVEAWPSGVVS
ncbi:MAG: HIT domain-containing protein [Microthrixaceae bacterium]